MKLFPIFPVVRFQSNVKWVAGFLALCLVFLYSPTRVDAQALSGMTGTVTDSSGAVVPDATVTVTNNDTGVTTHGVTSSTGTYVITDLLPGSYTVRIEKGNFQTAVFKSVNVEPAKKASVDAVLKAGTVSETMEVTASTITLETEQPQLATTIEHKVVEELPVEIGGVNGGVAVVGRQIDDYLFLAPGTQGGEFSHRINGGVDFENEVVFNGVAAVQAETKGFQTFINPPFEMVSEFSVLTSVFSAQYGLAQGVASYQFASGTNTLHGDAFEIMRNSYFDAPGVSLANQRPNGTCCLVPPLHRHNYGISLGGPVWIPHVYNGKDKTFWHLNIEWFRQNALQTGTMTVPTAAEKTGDFSGLVDGNGTPIKIFVPTAWASDPTLVPPGCTVPTGPSPVQWPGNKIPQNCISAASALVVPLIADPNIAGTLKNNATSQAGLGLYRQPNWGLSIDHNLTEKQKIHGSFWRDKETTPSCCDNNALYALNNPITGQNPQVRLGTGIFLTYSNAFTNHLVMTAGAGWMGEINNQFNPNVNNPFPGVAGSISFPNINFGSTDPNAVEPGALGQARTFSLNRKLGLSFDNNWLYTRGRHTLNIGMEIHRAYQDDQECQNCGAGVSFSNLTTSDPGNSAASGSAFASFLLGQVDSASRNFAPESRLRNLYVAPYVQDDIKITPKLTVNVGLRWDILRPFTENHNNVVFFDPTIPNPGAISTVTGQPLPGAASKFGTCPGCAGFTHGDVQWKHFSPRVGFAYRVTENTVLLGGFALSTLEGGAFEFGDNKVANAMGQWLVGTLNVASNNSATPAWGEWDNKPVANPPALPFTPTIGNATTVGAGGLRYFNRTKIVAPYTQSWNIGFQRELPRHTLLSLSYVGNRDIHLPGMLNPPNQLNPALLSALCPNPAPVTNPSDPNFTLVINPTCLLSQDNPNGNAWTGAAQQAALQSLGFGSVTYGPTPGPGIVVCPSTSNGAGTTGTFFAPYQTFACDWGTGRGLRQAVLPYPQYDPSNSAGGLANTFDMTGTSFYNALQAKAERRFTNGLSFLVSYTLSKNMANTDTGFSTFNFGSLNKYNQKSEWTLSGNDQTHILTISGVYELPIGPGKRIGNYTNTAARLLLGGWQLSGILNYASGTPQTVFANYNPYGNGFNRANLVAGQPINLNLNNYYQSLGKCSTTAQGVPTPCPSQPATAFNVNAFALPGYTGGNSPRVLGGLRTAFFKGENIGFAKHLRFTERVEAELRMEFFNLFNRVIVCSPDLNVQDGPLNFGIVNPNGSGGSSPCQANAPRQGQAFFKISF